MIINFGRDEVTGNDTDIGNILIQFWAASCETIQGGRRYCELTIPENPFEILSYDGGGLSWYRINSVACTITIQLDDEQDDNKLQGKQPEGVISRAFRYKRPEMTPNISFYSLHEYPHKEFALSCGIQSSLCFPLFKTVDCSGLPGGVIELVSTGEQDLEKFKQYFDSCFYVQKIRMYTSRDNLIYRFIRTNDLNPALLEMDRVLTLLCQNFPLHLAQYWVITDPNLGALSLMYQKSNLDSENLTPLSKFKDACLQTRLNIGEGLVGKTYLSQKSFFCWDITEFDITNYPLAHYARSCGSIACFTIFLRSLSPPCGECVLEFFLPSQEMTSYYLLILLRSLLATVEEHIQYYSISSGEELGQVLKVEFITSSTQNEPGLLKIGQPENSLLLHEGSKNYRDLQPLSEYATEKDEHGLNIEKGNSTTATGKISKRTPNNAPAIINLDELEEESPIKRIEPQPLSSKPKRSEEISDEGDTTEIDHSGLAITLGKAIRHRGHTVAAKRVNEPVEDVGHSKTNAAGSSLQTRISLPHEEVEEETMMPDISDHELMRLEDAFQITNKGIIVGAENDDTTIQFVSETCVHDILEREKQVEKEISYESLSQHFGRPLDDVAKIFSISRSTFKRKCRDLGIKRWKSGRRRTNDKNSSKLRARINAKEPIKRHVSFSGISPVHNTVVIADTDQDLKKMTVEATYYGATIRFELPGSGLAELEDNIIEMLHLERESFSIKYQDDEGDWIIIACDEDVEECLRVLVVDHDLTCLRMVEKMLQRCSYVITACSEVTVASELLLGKKGCFDLVLSDADMPDMGGFKLLKLARMEMELPVIIMSADARTTAVMRRIRHGACDYLIKPMKVGELKNIWQHVIRKQWSKILGQEDFRSLDDNDWGRRGTVALQQPSRIMPLIFEDSFEGVNIQEASSQQPSPIMQLLLDDSCRGSENEGNTSQKPSYEETGKQEKSKKLPEKVGEIIHLDELKDGESPIKCIKSQFLTSQLKRSKKIVEEAGSTMETDHFTPEMTVEEAKRCIQETVAAKRVDERIEESPFEDIGCTLSNKDSGCAMTTAAQPSSFPTNAIIVGLEQDDTTINYVSKTSIQDTSEREKHSKKDISFESFSEHFGRPLDDVAKSFGVSRSTFKRICRDLGIKRWQCGKRRMAGNVSTRLNRRLNDKEPNRRNFSCTGMPLVQDTGVAANTSQDLNKMIVKATYNGVTMRFELLGLSGIVELEDNVVERLHLEKGSFSLKYQDNEGDWKTTIKMLVDRPLNHCAP
ncbi:hypothetical protein POM88_002650 [Heracleum sosnowskyi]|uniref:Uncharacterized protein n=1 Tax=Heracleum sosnowskyi TaxID=360622 RepID=A0AAD8JIU6_9APIA|nr:hypothetical protein POM88_002650 [Heracleum sosnowskyi]